MQPKPSAPEDHVTLDVSRIEQELRAERAYAQDGHTARTLLRTHDLRVVLVVMRAGASIDQHQTDHTAVIHVLSGSIRIRLPDRIAPVTTGGLFALEARVVHAVDADVDSAFLLTLAWHDK